MHFSRNAAWGGRVIPCHVRECMAMINFAIILLLFGPLIIPVKTNNCPDMHYGPSCLKCNCTTEGSKSCDPKTGNCQCKKGFSGPRCVDVDECAGPGGDRVCSERYTYCSNTHGAFECKCKRGYQRVASGKCYPCMHGRSGSTCENKCDCVDDNTASCLSETGTCVCKSGWEGIGCKRSVNDCEKRPCNDQRCVDTHKGYYCECEEEGKRFVEGKCRDFSIQLGIMEQSPVYGQLMSVYIFYQLSYPYIINPFNEKHPDFVYQIQINDKPVCKVSFRKTHVRIKDRRWIHEMLNSDAYHHFYSHFVMRRSDPSISIIQAVPDGEEYNEISRTVDACKNDVATRCLHSMTISGTSPCRGHDFSCIRKNVPEKHRQKYHKFKLILDQTKACQNNYKFNWTYMKLSDRHKTDANLCLTGQELDIMELVSRSGELSITDHHGEVEVLPKNTLPFGLILICVEAKLENIEANSAVSCGVINVISSITIVGKLKPYARVLYCAEKTSYTIEAHFREPDRNLPLKYHWYSLYSSNKLDSANWRKNAYHSQHIAQLYGPKQWFYCEPRDHRFIEFSVKVEANPKIKRVIKLKVYPRPYTFLLRCHAACGETVGSDQTLVLTINPTGRKPRRFNLNQVEVAHARKSNNFLVLKPAAAQQEKTPTIYAEASNTYHGYYAYGITVPEAPTGDGCSISPQSGTAIFTKFTVKCKNYAFREDDMLRFHLYRKDSLIGENEQFFNLIAYGGNPEISGITLSSQKGGSTEIVQLKVKILSIYDTHREVDLSVQLQVDDQKATMQKVMDTLTESFLDSNRQENVRFINDVASAIFPKGTASEADKLEARNELLKKLGNYKGKTADWVMLTALALEKSTGREEEMKPHGVSAGLKAASQLTDYLHEVGKNNIYIAGNVTRVLTSAVDRLIYKASSHGRDIIDGKIVLRNRKPHLMKNKKDCQRGVESIKKIIDSMFRTLIGYDEQKIETFRHIEIGVNNRHMNKDGTFQFGSKNISFYMPGISLGLGKKKEFMDASYHIYDKNPYAFAAEQIHGGLPLLYVDFARRGGKPRDLTVPRSVKVSKRFRFFQPADVILEFPSPAAETKTYKLIVDVQKHGNKQVVAKSSCLFISVPSSSSDTTALLIRSQNDLKLKVKMSYTNDVKELNNTGNETALEIPLFDVPTTTVSRQTLTRDQHTIFLPQLTQTELKEQVQYYRLSISIKLGLDVTTKHLKLAPNQGNIKGSGSASGGITAHLSNITIAPFRMACKNYVTALEAFKSDICYMTEFSTLNHLHCRCIVAGAYTGSVKGVSSMIYPLNHEIFFEKRFYNPLAATLLVATWMVFMALARWARILDRHDTESCKVTPLEDNSEQNMYLYLIGVSTGWSSRAGTSSNVYIYLKGSWGRSGVHHLYDRSKQLFQKGAHNWFILTTSDDIGDMKSVVIWTDFSGAYPSWFLKSIFVENLQTNESWVFQYNSWLSIAYGGRQLVTDIPVYQERALTTLWIKQVHNTMKSDMRNDHLWIGLFAKTPTDRFTRVQRLATGLTVLHTLMLLNLMVFRIFQVDVSAEDRQQVTFFGQNIHLSSILISLKSASYMTLLGIFLGFVFYRTRDKPVAEPSAHFSQEQQDMVMRQEDMTSRKRRGLSTFFPFLTSTEYDSTVDAASDEEESDSHIDGTGSGKVNEKEGKKKRIEEKHEVKEEEQTSVEPERETWNKVQSDLDQWKQELEANKRISSMTFMLPWWSIYLTWLLVLGLNGALAIYIAWLGLALQQEESLEWLLSFVMGVFFNFAVFIPILVFLKAAVRVLIFRRKQTKREEGPISHLAEGLMLMLKERINRKTGGSYKRKRTFAHPPMLGDANNVLERLKVESEAREMMRDLVLYTLFMATILIIINGHLNVNMEYKQKVSIENELLGLKGEELLDDDEDGLLSQIHKIDDMWNYLIDVVAVRLIPEVDDLKQDTSRDYLIMGRARLRQVRSITSDTHCFGDIPNAVWPRDTVHKCIQPLSGRIPEQKGHFGGNWDSPNASLDDLPDDSVYKYYPAHMLKAATFFGEHGIYSGGGYVQTFLREDPSSMQIVLRQLSNLEWVDRYTRCIFLEFTVYHSHVDMFTQVTIAFEQNIYGGVFASESINTANISLHDRDNRTWFKLVEITALVCLVLSLFGSITRLQREGPKVFFYSLWSWAELLMVFLTILCIVFYVMRQNSFLSVMKQFRTSGHSFILDFTSVFFWQILFHVTMGLAGAIAILKMLKVTTFNPFWKTFTRTVAIGFGDFRAFMFATTFIIFAYCSFGRMIFGSHAKSYSSFSGTMMTLLFFILGEADYEVLIEVDLAFGRFFFLTFMFISQYLVVFIFIAILRDALDLARYMQYRHEQAVIRYIVDTILLYLNAFSPQVISASEEKESL